MNITTIVVGAMATNCYIAGDMIIDPGDAPEHISDVLTKLQVSPKMIVATHGHFDHIMGAYALQLMYDIPFYIHPDDMFLLKNMQSSAKHFLNMRAVDPPPIPTDIHGGNISFIHTPGHTPGSICLEFNDTLLVGDTLFADGSVGRTDHSYSSPLALSESVAKIRSHPAGTRILSGHGETSTITL